MQDECSGWLVGWLGRVALWPTGFCTGNTTETHIGVRGLLCCAVLWCAVLWCAVLCVSVAPVLKVFVGKEYSKDETALYGDGIYFACDASYSHNSAHILPSGKLLHLYCAIKLFCIVGA